MAPRPDLYEGIWYSPANQNDDPQDENVDEVIGYEVHEVYAVLNHEGSDESSTESLISSLEGNFTEDSAQSSPDSPVIEDTNGIYEHFAAYVETGHLNAEEVQAQSVAASEDLQAISLPAVRVEDEVFQGLGCQAEAKSEEGEGINPPECHKPSEDQTENVAASKGLKEKNSPPVPNELLEEITANVHKRLESHLPEKVRTPDKEAASDEVNTPTSQHAGCVYESSSYVPPGCLAIVIEDVFTSPGYPNLDNVQDEKKSDSEDLEAIYASGYPDAEDVFETPEYMHPGSPTLKKVNTENEVSSENTEEIHQTVCPTDDVYQTNSEFVYPRCLGSQEVLDQTGAAYGNVVTTLENNSRHLDVEEVYESPRSIDPGDSEPEEVQDQMVPEYNVEEIYENSPVSVASEESNIQEEAFTKVLRDVLASRQGYFVDIYETPNNYMPPGWISPDEIEAQGRAASEDLMEIQSANEMRERQLVETRAVRCNIPERVELIIAAHKRHHEMLVRQHNAQMEQRQATDDDKDSEESSSDEPATPIQVETFPTDVGCEESNSSDDEPSILQCSRTITIPVPWNDSEMTESELTTDNPGTSTIQVNVVHDVTRPHINSTVIPASRRLASRFYPYSRRTYGKENKR